MRARLQRPRSLARALDSAALDSCSDRRRSDRRHSNQRRSDRRLSVLGHFSLAHNANALNDTITEDSSRTAERARTAQGCSSPLRHTRLGMRQEHSRAHSSTGGSSGQSRCRQAAACSHQRPTGRSCRKWRCTRPRLVSNQSPALPQWSRQPPGRRSCRWACPSRWRIRRRWKGSTSAAARSGSLPAVDD